MTEDGIEKTVDEIKQRHSEFDALINCAGVLSEANLDSLDYKSVENLIKLNLIAPLMLVSRLTKLIKGNEADIVNFGSTIGFKAYENQAAYGASKWGLRGLNENLQKEFKETNVRVIGFNPGGFNSKLHEKATGSKIDNPSDWMDPKDLARLLLQLLEMPKNMEVSNIVINRK